MERTEGRKPSTKKKPKSKVTLGEREQRRLVQLAICLALFLLVFVGRGVFPDKMEGLEEELSQLMEEDTDFQGAFTRLGQSVQAGEPVVDSLSELWVAVFAGGELTVGESVEYYQTEQAYLSSDPTVEHIVTRRLEVSPYVFGVVETEEETEEEEQTEALSTEPEEPAEPESSMQPAWGESITPVMAVMSSPYGVRVHPISGEEVLHAGVDLAAEYGTEIQAFASGVVEYIGESPVYGLYLQITHEGGWSSFYAHCSQLLVQAGQTVTVGETVALVGDTGDVTGAHLHFELKENGVQLDPAPYIETLSP